MLHNLLLYKQMTGQNLIKLFKMLIYVSKIIPLDVQANELNFEKIDLQQISHTNGDTEISSVVAKKLLKRNSRSLILA